MKVIEAYRDECAKAGNEPALFSWARDDDAALDGARIWKGADPMGAVEVYGEKVLPALRARG